MKNIRIGDFKKQGAFLKNGEGVFTFSVNKGDDPSLVLFDTESKRQLKNIPLSKEFRHGRMFSVAVSGFDWDKTGYLIKRGGEPEMDIYAGRTIGREVWDDEERVKNNYRIFGGLYDGSFDWGDDRTDFLDPSDVIIYKLHMRGYTMEHGLSFREAGNYRGVLKKLPELKKLGITALEFLPIYDFEELRYNSVQKISKKGNITFVPEAPYGINYWGYGPAMYFAPKASYFGGEDAPGNMKDMVKKIHAQGMEVYMEFSFTPDMSAVYILECIKHWVSEYHIDGFHLLGIGLPIEMIAEDPYLGATKIFYERYPGEVLYDENKYDHKHLFQYDSGLLYPLRKLQNHMDGSIIEFANQIKRQNSAYGFVNYAAINSGFTLRDTYSYSEKHNEKNGEDNTDGDNYNFSHNYSVEGETQNKSVINIRMRHIRTALATVILSQGIPLILSGDEAGNTQYGNNNAYCQDNEIGWVTYERKKRYQYLKKYVENLCSFRKSHPVIRMNDPCVMSDYKHLGIPDLSYHGKEPWTMWLSDDKKSLGIMYFGAYSGKDEEDVMLCFNFYFGEDMFALPHLPGNRKWFMVSNTTEEIWSPSDTPLPDQTCITVPGGSLTILAGKPWREKKEQDKIK